MAHSSSAQLISQMNKNKNKAHKLEHKLKWLKIKPNNKILHLMFNKKKPPIFL